MIDSHAHIYLPQLKEELSEILHRAEQSQLESIIMPGIEEKSWQQMIEMENNSTVKLFKSFGIHPCDVQDDVSNYENLLFNYCSNQECVAIGETGLDYYWSTERVSQQKTSLEIHCEVAKQLKKPIILHNRESTKDLLDLIEFKQDGSLTGVWHCFTGTIDEGKRALDLGLHLGIGGVITFKNGGVDKTVQALGKLLDNKIMLETDSPYLAPKPHRGKQNEPSFLTFIVSKLAECVNKSEDELIKETTVTAKKLFNL